MATCLLVVVMPSLAVVRPPAAAARAPDRGLTRATALKVRSGRTYSVSLPGQSSQRWLVVRDPYDPENPCSGRCPERDAGAASALVEASVQSHGGTCVAHVVLLGPTQDPVTGATREHQVARGLVTPGTAFTAAAAPDWFGRVYLGLTPDPSFRCSHARYRVRLTVQRALASGFAAVAGSASAAQYGNLSTTLEREQSICFHKGQALDRYTGSLSAQILADGRRRGYGRRIARLRAAINAATRRYFATPCPPR